MSADSLSTNSRNFYEHTRTKMVGSIFLASMAMISLGFCSAFGGQSDSANYYRKNSSGWGQDAQQSLVGGYGFASFCFFVAFAVFLAAAIYISPLFCGSATEKKLLNRPDEIEGSGFTGAGYAGSNHGNSNNNMGGSNHEPAHDKV